MSEQDRNEETMDEVEIAELGAVSTETRGLSGSKPEGIGTQP